MQELLVSVTVSVWCLKCKNVILKCRVLTGVSCLWEMLCIRANVVVYPVVLV